MYENFYGFKEKPFSLLPDPSFLYFGKMHSTAYAILEYGLLNRADFTVITGEIGSGKTTLIRYLLDQLEDDVTVGLLNSGHPEKGELLRWVLLSFGLEYQDKDRIALHDQFTRFLIDQYAQKKRTVLIVDEAQNLDADVLEELRLLSNLNADKDQVLQTVLVGQPELKSLLKRPELKQLLQRVSVDFHLTGLSENGTLAYIYHRTRCAGRKKPLFTKNACYLIYHASKGIPRVINSLCDMALVYGFADKKPCISSGVVKNVLIDKEDSGLFHFDIASVEGSSELEQSDATLQTVILKSMDSGDAKGHANTANVTRLDVEAGKQSLSEYNDKKRK